MRLYLAYFNLVACDLVPFDSNFETECKLFTQHLVLDNDCCISENVRRTKINLVTSNKWLLIFWLDVLTKRPLFATKSASI